MAVVASAIATVGLCGLAPANPARAALAVIGINDSLSARHDRTTTVAAPGVLGNDLNLLGGTTADLVDDVSHGSLTLRSDGGYTYTPDPGFIGSDSFRYRPSGLLSSAAQVSITVTNTAPLARNDSLSTPSRTTLVVTAPGVLANDTDADGDALVAELVGGGVSGSVDVESNGAFTYEPGGGFQGTASFQYRVWDGIAWSSATVTLTVTAPPAEPTPQPTPTPMPTPAPTPKPILPVPSLPLPPLPPLPSLLPDPTAIPAPELPPGADPSTTPAPSPSPGSRDGSRRESSDADALPAAAEAGSGPPSLGPDDPQGPAGAASVDGPLSELVVAVGVADDDLGIAGLDVAFGLDVYAVPAAVLAGPGLLILLWVLLQTFGAVAWVPAVRRLHGRDEGRAAGG